MPKETVSVQIPERGAISLSASAYRTLTDSPLALELVQNGILTFFKAKDIPYGVRASCFVGHALLESGHRIEISEKTPGALRELLIWSLPDDLRAIDVSSGIGPNAPILEVFARSFLRSVSYYLRHGLSKAYLSRLEIASLVRGKIAIKDTLRLLSRGKRGLLVQQSSQLSSDLLVNRLLRLGLLAVERVLIGREDARDALAEARMYEPMFADAAIYSFRSMSYSSISSLFDRSMNDSRMSNELRASLAYARALVLNLGIWPDSDQQAVIPESFFLNLERLFEGATRQVLTEMLPDLLVCKGSFLKKPLFETMASRYIADPDVVIDDAGQISLVVDTKYKNPPEFPGHDDIYQLFAHCSALKAKSGLLLYPGDDCQIQTLGVTQSGLEVRFGTVRIRSLKTDIIMVLENCGLLPNQHSIAAV